MDESCHSVTCKWVAKSLHSIRRLHTLSAHPIALNTFPASTDITTRTQHTHKCHSPTVLSELRHLLEFRYHLQRSGAVGAKRAHNPETVWSKLTFATSRRTVPSFWNIFFVNLAFFICAFGSGHSCLCNNILQHFIKQTCVEVGVSIPVPLESRALPSERDSQHVLFCAKFLMDVAFITA